MKTLTLGLAIILMAFTGLCAQSSDSDYSGFIDPGYPEGAYYYSNHHVEAYAFSQLERELQAQVLIPLKALLNFREDNFLLKAILFGMLIVGFTCFFSTFSRSQARSTAREAFLPDTTLSQPASKAS